MADDASCSDGPDDAREQERAVETSSARPTDPNAVRTPLSSAPRARRRRRTSGLEPKLIIPLVVFAVVLGVSVVLLIGQPGAAPTAATEAGCYTALSYTLEEVQVSGAELGARALKNLEAASRGRLESKVKVSSDRIEAVERVCQQVCAIWSQAKVPEDRQRFGSRLEACLNRAIEEASHASRPGSPQPPAAPLLLEPETEVPLEFAGLPKKSGLAEGQRGVVECTRTDAGFIANITERGTDSESFLGCCVDLPEDYVSPWTRASVNVKALRREDRLDVKLEDHTGERQAYLHSSRFTPGERVVTGGLNDLRGEAAYRLCAMAVGANTESPENTITVTRLRLGKTTR